MPCIELCAYHIYDIHAAGGYFSGAWKIEVFDLSDMFHSCPPLYKGKK